MKGSFFIWHQRHAFDPRDIYLHHMSAVEIWEQFVTGMKLTTWYEYLAVFAGILSVWFSRKENILVYPVGLINTIIYVYISVKGHLLGEAAVNFYYTVMSVYGWMLWSRKDQQHHFMVRITSSGTKEWMQQLAFFLVFYISIYAALVYLKNEFWQGAIPWADAFASATAFTGMWLMARKKVESWYWWIATNIASIPLYFVKQYVFTSVYYVVLLAFAFWGLAEWKKRESINKA